MRFGEPRPEPKLRNGYAIFQLKRLLKRHGYREKEKKKSCLPLLARHANSCKVVIGPQWQVNNGRVIDRVDSMYVNNFDVRQFHRMMIRISVDPYPCIPIPLLWFHLLWACVAPIDLARLRYPSFWSRGESAYSSRPKFVTSPDRATMIQTTNLLKHSWGKSVMLCYFHDGENLSHLVICQWPRTARVVHAMALAYNLRLPTVQPVLSRHVPSRQCP